MIEDEQEVFRQKVDLPIDHGPLSDSEIFPCRPSLRSCSRSFYLWIDPRVEPICQWFEQPGMGMGAHHHSSPSSPSTDTIILDDSLLIDWTPMRVKPIPAVYTSSSQVFRMMVHLICMFLVLSTFPSRVCRQLGLPQTS
ncbi:hypothetical protein AMTR_s00034p00047320 [Amborella trichopoda]|uniref:Uncharacterized protein n=1 Tax=Amborella trichopoda TaxID=13333 RepID=W1PWE4_AMBTC|nr:hypothetical protein AMTR_s00034p00047320 [Amborella trichopoda]